MFTDTIILQELDNIVNTLHLSGDHIKVKSSSVPITGDTYVATLTGILYSQYYALKQSCRNSTSMNTKMPMGNDSVFLKQLSENNRTQDRVEHGWKINRLHTSGYVDISRSEQHLTVPLSQIMNYSNGQAPALGQIVSVYFPREQDSPNPGFYYVYSNTGINAFQVLTRIYWNVTAEGAAILTNYVTTKLNHYRIPFMFKCLNHPELYTRRDSAVLYVAEYGDPLLYQVLQELAHSVREYLQEDVPLFTFKYADGIGIAESPSVSESFGMHRMSLLAQSMVKHFQERELRKTLIHHMASTFLQHGINPQKPYLNKGSRELFIETLHS